MGETREISGELTQRLVDRLCHDIAGSIQALSSGVDLLTEAGDSATREEAASFIADAVAGQRSRLAYARRAFGSAPPATETAELAHLANGMFADLRASLDWAVEAERLGPAGARCLLNLVQIAAEILAVGGVAKVMARTRPAGSEILVEARGPRLILRPETRAGLAGEPLAGGLAGRWVQAALVSALTRAAGGRVGVEEAESTVTIRIDLPPEG
jgi:histidine phosphotransferase ChpT